MRRRAFLTLIGGAAAGALSRPLPLHSQQPATPTIGFLRSTSAKASADLVAALQRGLRETGYVEGQNLAIEYRWAEGRNDMLPALATDLVRLRVAVLVTANLAAMVAAKSATKTIPIVFVTGDDPVKLGFVSSLNRPAGNITGISFYSGATVLGSKQLELLHELVPNAVAIGMLVNSSNPGTEEQTTAAQAAARAIGRQIQILKVRTESDFDAAFATLAQLRLGALLIGGDALFMGQRQKLVALAARHRVPTIHFAREYVAAGGLMSYGTSIPDAYRQVGVYAGKILKGAKPADLPVTLPTRFELVINLKTAKSLGLAIPTSLIARADEVIE